MLFAGRLTRAAVLRAAGWADTIVPAFKVTVPVKVLALERISEPLPFLVKPALPEATPARVVLAAPSKVSTLTPRLRFEFRVRLPEAALNVCAALRTIGTFKACSLAELFTIPPLPLVSVLPAVPIVKLPAVLSNVTPVTL